LPGFRACTVVSEVEKKLLEDFVPQCRNVHVIPNGIQTADYTDFPHPTPQPDTLIFTGSLSYSANLDGMHWFLTEVYPKVLMQNPAVKLIITGQSSNVSLPPVGNVTLTGHVEDIRPLIASAWISLAPIRIGGGTRLKILEAMALGTPVVATGKGAEGLQVKDGEHLLLADTPDQFSEAVNRLLQDGELRRKLAANSCSLIRQQYDWSVIMPDFLRLAEEAVHVW
jgi:glycosyltransferase involved in cell wall biosynthesis